MIDASVPQSARVWNYWMGGKDYYPADKAVADEILETNPHVLEIARAARDFLRRAITRLVHEHGVRQFLCVGSELPTAQDVHVIAQAAAPESRVVYVADDPLVLAHARALLVGTAEGATGYVGADIRETGRIVREAARTLDLSRPVALVLAGVLAHVTDDGEARVLVAELMAALAPGSLLVVSDDTDVIHPEEMDAMVRRWNASGGSPRVNRTPERLAAFFEGLELLEPGVVSCPRWRPDPTEVGSANDVDEHCGVGRKP
ncbi:SAM-dependent methyltransferase [Nocardiopsis sp. NPDC006198]|uniref:SAM-dependent methyltransferase n=1 Tax=Streptomonospora nanhaiensis TaxID=1323731 RepID=A0ABY6YX43_9ACTN|nr:SAM-dependent methyltransferase [Streptomonospora nanhaiensis]WAE76656.1 SAM-dependent methyltransferase [Streptomonospora nanhaiensis]